MRPWERLQNSATGCSGVELAEGRSIAANPLVRTYNQLRGVQLSDAWRTGFTAPDQSGPPAHC
jgi:hypothetical protein